MQSELMTTRAIRRANLLSLLGNDEIRTFAERYDLSEGYISQIKNDTRGMGGTFARKVEKACNLTPGWMDQPHNTTIGERQEWSLEAKRAAAKQLGPELLGKENYDQLTREDGTVDIPIFDAAGSMGLGQPIPERDTVVDHMRMTKTWVNRNLPSISTPSKLAVLSAYGDSMSPTFSDGDILLIDSGVTEIRIDAVYVLALNDELYIKRIQRRPDGSILMISDNKSYEPYVIQNGDRENFRVLGRVVWSWNGRKL